MGRVNASTPGPEAHTPRLRAPEQGTDGAPPLGLSDAGWKPKSAFQAAAQDTTPCDVGRGLQQGCRRLAPGHPGPLPGSSSQLSSRHRPGARRGTHRAAVGSLGLPWAPPLPLPCEGTAAHSLGPPGQPTGEGHTGRPPLGHMADPRPPALRRDTRPAHRSSLEHPLLDSLANCGQEVVVRGLRGHLLLGSAVTQGQIIS